jgi:hypothetical protein
MAKTLATNTIYRLYVEKLGAESPTGFVGNKGELFYNPNDGNIKYSDGVTPGGVISQSALVALSIVMGM